jgi:hypothetical protein
MRRATVFAALLLALSVAPSAGAASAWHSAQPVAGGIGVPTTIGEVGDIEFWAPNRGMLITAGNEGVAPGLFAYDGSGWYRYSTVCGGHEGRIAYAGPNDFWTISDQQSGQETGGPPAEHISLCHFVGGAVVASYAEPLGVPGSYLPMDAAACASPGNCWFAGERLPGTTNVGAFHLHWDGSAIAAIPSLTEPQAQIEDPGRSVTGLAYHQGAFYESVAVRPGDEPIAEEASEPSLLHQIFTGAGLLAFLPLYTEAELTAEPEELEGLHLSGDEEELWAVAGAEEGSSESVTALRLGEGGFEPVALQDPGSVFSPGDRIDGVAAEPGTGSAWVSFRQPADFGFSKARVAQIHADGSVGSTTLLPAEGEGIGPKGPAGPIACSATGQCWMATEGGWLFHLGPDPARNEDPVLHALVTYRPPDASLPSVPPTSLPEDDSGALSGSPSGEESAEIVDEPLPKRKPPIFSGLQQKVIGGHVLELSFLLRVKAHVQLLAKRKAQVVAKTKRYTMAKGRQSLRLSLDPKRWPTKLDLQVHPIQKRKVK